MEPITISAPERCQFCNKFCGGWPLWKFAEHLVKCLANRRRKLHE